MPELPALAEVHFLRPAWLLVLVPALALVPLVRWREDPRRPWKGVIAPHLLDHLVVGREGRARFRPVHLTALVLALSSLGAAGPTWEREPTPFTEDRAPLVVVLDVSMSMNAIDVKPTRLERAKQKVRDLLALRSGSRTALVAFSGTAHVVMPLTDDAAALETYLVALDTTVLPVRGKAPARALGVAARLLEREEAAGSILLVTDGIPEDDRSAFVEHAGSSRHSLLVLALGTSEGGPVRIEEGRYATDPSGNRLVARLDREGLTGLADETGAFVATATVDDRDVGRIQRRVQQHLEEVREAEASGRWKDMGWYLLFPVVALQALWFRRGWTVRW